MFSTRAAAKLITDVEPWTPPTMRYKLILEGRRDDRICSFCRKTYRTTYAVVTTQTESSIYCCDNKVCKRKKNKIYYDLAMADTDKVQALYAHRKARYASDPEVRAYHYRYSRQHRIDHPEMYVKYRETYSAKKAAEHAAKPYLCPMCGTIESLAEARTDRLSCRQCRPERQRLVAKLIYHRRKGNTAEVVRLTALLTKF
jgi:hypothetical protein